ncbi:MAG: aminotransferase class I/II-fold pyridoxal phosphate-dependent enzyme [Dehalococcoidia bacterium]|nr:aminotransferase class I/II-fold pyridoxal phosphate-dependent enzyme [Dehalococcoidia bacterium]
MQLAKRIEQLPPYLFVEISKKIAAKRAQGISVVSFGIGDPDLPTPDHILQGLWKAAQLPANHRYPESDGLPEFRKAIAGWYSRRFAVTLNPDTEVLPLIGAKEGIGHMALCLLDPGDIALVPDPGYPVYSIGTMFAGATSHWMPLLEENGYLPDLDAIPPDIARKAKVMWLNYPNNPTGAVCDLAFFEKAVAYCKKYEIALCHDAPYTEIAYGGLRPPSVLQARGAMDIAIEFHSFSKTYNMTGWRVGMAVGNPKLVNALMRVKSNLDSGIPQAIQLAAMAALAGDQSCVADNVRHYQHRRDTLVAALAQIGLKVLSPKASLYIWARVPQGYTSAAFAAKLIDEAAVVVTPGSGYGRYGEGYVRLSLTLPDDQLQEGVRRIASLKLGTQA